MLLSKKCERLRCEYSVHELRGISQDGCLAMTNVLLVFYKLKHYTFNLTADF
jgi:hypothetical protein